MPQWLPVLIMIFAVILVVDSIGSFMMWKFIRNRLFFIAGVGWAANFINFTIHGIATGHDSFTLVGHSFYFITAVCLAITLLEVVDIPYKLKDFFYIGVGMVTASISTYHLFKSYFISAMIIDLCIASVMVVSSIRTIRKFSGKKEPLLMVFSILTIVTGLHYLDYPFLHADPKGTIFGFSFAFLLSILNSIVLPMIILNENSKKYTNELEELVQVRTADLQIKTKELEVANQDKNALL